MAAFEDRDHRISAKEAAAHVQRHRAAHGKPAEGDHGGAFHADQVLAILSQQGCAALRFYYGRNERGHRNLVLVGVDEKGIDMTAGEICEIAFPCPPFCPDTTLA